MRATTTRDVVEAAVLVGGPDQLLAHGVQVVVAGRDRLDLLVLHHARQAVGADDVEVAEGGLVDVNVDLHRVLHPERAHDDVLVRERRDLVGREVLHLDVVVQQRVIFGQLLHDAVATPIEPAVADVPDDQRAIEEQRRHHGGPHAVAARILLRLLVDLEVRQLDRRHHPVDVVAMAVIHLERPGQLLIVLGRLEEADDRIDRHATGDLAGGVPAHAVGDDRQTFALGQVERVLVVGALHAHVRVTREPQPHPVQRKRRAHRWPTMVSPRGRTINAEGGFRKSMCGPSEIATGSCVRYRSPSIV